MRVKLKLLSGCVVLLFFIVASIYLKTSTARNNHNADHKRQATRPQLKPIRPVRVNVAERGLGISSIEKKLKWEIGYKMQTKFEQVPERFLKNVTRRKISNFTISPTLIVSSPDRLFFLFVIKTTCNEIRRRTNMRKTWASVTEINGQKIGRVFLAGKADDEIMQKALEEENARYGDILQTEASDAYRGLPDKVLNGYQWFYYQKEAKADFYIFTDDDCVINMALLFDYFWTNREKFLADPSYHCGFVYNEKGAPERGKGKYAISHATYPSDRFPPFCHGGLTVMPYQQLCDIYRQAEITDRSDFHLEDVYITGILRTKVGKRMQNIKPMYYNGTNGRFPFYMGPFVWHAGVGRSPNQNVENVWKIVFNLMTVHTQNETFVGYWPSAEHVNAIVSNECFIPQIKDRWSFFKNNFGNFTYNSTDEVP